MKEAEDAAERDISNAPTILFPDRPKTPLPPSLPPSGLVGTYRNQGYGSLQLRQAPHPSSPGETILVADSSTAAWTGRLELHQASGDFWTVYVVDAAGPQAFYEGRFILGVDGRAAGLAVTLFDRSEMVYEGTIVYDKIA